MSQPQTSPLNRTRSHFSRRRFLAGVTAVAALPLWSGCARSIEWDVVVIGAGAAGLAATRTLGQAGRRVILIEASNRIGGRAHTDTSIFGAPYDLGAHWLHNAADNPLKDYGKNNGFTVYEAPEEYDLYVGSRKATEEERARYEGAYDTAYADIENAGKNGQDIAPAVVVKPDELGRWNGLVQLVIGPYEMGKDFDSFSCQDWWTGAEGTDFYCKEGYGALLAYWARGIPVELSTPASGVDWSGSGVTVDTPRGKFSAKACIITASMGVLANGRIQFKPKLPADKEAAFHGLTMGLYNRIALMFDGNPFDTGDDRPVLYQIETHKFEPPRGVGLLTNIGGTGLAFADVGGGFARELEAQGSEASIDFALSELRNIFGTAIDKSFVKGHATAWGRNRLTFGSYASAKPGASASREALRAPVANRLWFAGEACSADEWATVAGALKNGKKVADEVSKVL